VQQRLKQLVECRPLLAMHIDLAIDRVEDTDHFSLVLKRRKQHWKALSFVLLMQARFVVLCATLRKYAFP